MIRRVHLCKIGPSTTPVTQFLQQPVALTIPEMLSSIPAPVIRIRFSPYLLTVTLIGPIIRVAGHLLTLPPSFPGPLAGLPAAVTLVFNPGIGPNKPTAVHALNHRNHRLPPSRETINPISPRKGEVKEPEQKKIRSLSSGKEVKEGKRTRGLLDRPKMDYCFTGHNSSMRTKHGKQSRNTQHS